MSAAAGRRPDPIAPFLTTLALAGLGTGLARVADSLYAVTIRCTPAELGLLASCQSLAVLVMSLPSGALVRRHGPTKVFVGGSLLAGLTCAAVPLVPRPWFLVACFTGMGLCLPLRFVATNVVSMRRIDVEGSARAGWYRAIHLLSMFVVGPSVAVPVVAAVGFPGAWWFVATSFFLPAGVARLALGGALPSPGPARGATAWFAGGDPEALRLAATEFTAQGTFMFFSFFVIPIAMSRHGLGAPAAAGLLSAQAASFVLVLLTLGGVASRWARVRLALAAHGSAAVGLLVLGLARGGASLYAGSLLLGGGLGLVQMENLLRSARVGARAGQGAASGLQSLSGSAGGLMGGLLGGVLDGQSVFLLLAPLFASLGSRLPAPTITPASREGPAAPGTEPSRSPASSCGPGACAG